MIEHHYKQDSQKVSQFGYKDILKFSPICSPGQDMRKILHYK
jgi:hypothetical protein